MLFVYYPFCIYNLENTIFSDWHLFVADNSTFTDENAFRQKYECRFHQPLRLNYSLDECRFHQPPKNSHWVSPIDSRDGRSCPNRAVSALGSEHGRWSCQNPSYKRVPSNSSVLYHRLRRGLHLHRST